MTEKKFQMFCVAMVSMAGLNCFAAETYDRVTPVVKAYGKTKNMVVNIAGKRLMRGSQGFDWSDPFGGGFLGPRNEESPSRVRVLLCMRMDMYLQTPMSSMVPKKSRLLSSTAASTPRPSSVPTPIRI